MKRKQRKTRWLLAMCVALALGALVLAGCGGSSGASSSGSTAESSTTASAAGTEAGGAESGGSEAERSGTEGAEGGPGMMNISEEARACLKEKGVELPEFKGGEGGPPSGGEAPEGMPQGGEAPEGGMPEGGKPPQGGEGGPPAGGFGGEGSEKMTKAFEECGVEMPEFKGGPGGEGAPNMNTAAFKKQVKEYVACVRENGYELAEPNFSGEGPVFAKEESESAAFKKASAQCQSLLGGARAGSSESGTET
jgi:hypothetical protein